MSCAAFYYRVRLTKDDEKNQLFAGTKAGALAVCKTKPGYSVFDPDMKCIYTNNAKGFLSTHLGGKKSTEIKAFRRWSMGWQNDLSHTRRNGL